MPFKAWKGNPRFARHHFFNARPHFVFSHGDFAEWVMVAPEAGRFSYEMDKESGEAGFGDVVCVAP